jgi:hypothetical protein
MDPTNVFNCGLCSLNMQSILNIGFLIRVYIRTCVIKANAKQYYIRREKITCHWVKTLKSHVFFSVLFIVFCLVVNKFPNVDDFLQTTHLKTVTTTNKLYILIFCNHKHYVMIHLTNVWSSLVDSAEHSSSPRLPQRHSFFAPKLTNTTSERCFRNSLG